jgi:cobalt-zinc-cadmium efflux system outer membrane protein
VVPGLTELLSSLGATPALKGCKARAEQWGAEADLRGKEAVPDVEVAAGYRGLDGFGAHALVFEISVPVPLFDRRSHAVDEAKARRRAEEASCRAEQIKLRAQVGSHHSMASAVRLQHGRFRDVLVPEAVDAYKAALEALVQGEVDVQDVLGLAEHLTELERRSVDLVEGFWMAVLGFETLVGTELVVFSEVQQ